MIASKLKIGDEICNMTKDTIKRIIGGRIDINTDREYFIRVITH